MDTAYNLRTKEIVGSDLIDVDPRYQNVNKSEWVLDSDNIENLDSIKETEEYPNKERIPVEFIKEKEYERFIPRYKKVWCSPYFKLPKGLSDKLNINLIAESEEHKLAKKFFYNQIKYNNENLEFIYSIIGKQEKKLSIKFCELDVDYKKIAYEKNLKSIVKSNRIDLYVPFKQKHELLGYGILFEIQFSSQNKEQTKSRNIQRASKGFSIVWIHKTDFVDFKEKDLTLKNPQLKIFSYTEVINSVEKQIHNNFKSLVENQETLIENKMQEQLNNLASKHLELKQSLKNYYQGIESNFKYLEDWILKQSYLRAGSLCPKCKLGYLFLTISKEKLCCTNISFIDGRKCFFNIQIR